jgi:hypothetical protein
MLTINKILNDAFVDSKGKLIFFSLKTFEASVFLFFSNHKFVNILYRSCLTNFIKNFIVVTDFFFKINLKNLKKVYSTQQALYTVSTFELVLKRLLQPPLRRHATG